MPNRQPSEDELRRMALDLDDYEAELVEDGHGPFTFDRSLIKVDKAFRHKIFDLRSRGMGNAQIAEELGLTELEVEVVIERDQAKIKQNPKWEKCLNLYREGFTYEEIGQKVNLTRERVRQICNKQLAVEMGFGPTEQLYRKDEINEKYKSIVKVSRTERVEDNVEEKLNEALDKGLDPQYFDSFQKFTTATGISSENLKRFKPDVYKQIEINQRRRKNRWSMYYDACRICGSTQNEYRSKGYCVKCYFKTDEWKEMVKMSYQRNKASRQAAFKKYAEDYYNRPEIIEKMEREYDEKYFGGNRKLALERDDYKCRTCGMSIDVKYQSGKPKVRVWHLNDPNDHRLENLGTYDQSCFIKKYGANGKFNLRRRN